MDLITCVITTYNRSTDILHRAIKSVVNQTYSPIELVVVNDFPEDLVLASQIRSMLQSYTEIAIHYIEHSQNMGACQARNTAIQFAHGKYIAFLDDDDEWLPEKLEMQYSLIENSDETALVYCAHYEIKSNKKIEVFEELAREGNQNDDFKQLLKENFIGSTSYPLIRLSSIRELGGFKIGLPALQDHEMWLRIAYKYKLMYLKRPLVNYYHSQDSISTNKARKIYAFNYLLEEFRGDYEGDNNLFNYRLNYLAFICLKNMYWINMMTYLCKAIHVKWNSKNNFLVFYKLFRKVKRNMRSAEYQL